MSNSLKWMTGLDDVAYCADMKTGKIVGTMVEAGVGHDIYKVGFGGDFTTYYWGKQKATDAIEKNASASSSHLMKAAKNQNVSQPLVEKDKAD